MMSGESGMPGAFFQYELSPFMVRHTEIPRSFGHFLTNVCAIIGGVYTVAGLIDSLLYHSIKAIQKKIELGKLHWLVMYVFENVVWDCDFVISKSNLANFKKCVLFLYEVYTFLYLADFYLYVWSIFVYGVSCKCI